MSTKAEKKKKKKEIERKKTEIARVVDESLRSARSVEDPLASLAVFQKFNRNGLNLTIKHYHASKLPSDVFEWCFELTKKNMEALYEECPGWGWKDGKKRRELSYEDARVIVAVDAESSEPMGFLNYRFVDESGFEALYVFEVQVEGKMQGKGLGKFLMLVSEMIAMRAKMLYVMLTVFTQNHGAIKFYKNHLKYVVDDTSPSYNAPLHTSGFEILSKCLQPKEVAKRQTDLGVL
jgi:N-alpha-acetyltransferase 40